MLFCRYRTLPALHQQHFVLANFLQAIWMELQEAVHAVDSMVTQTPSEAGL
jgi:hypothetical protein